MGERGVALASANEDWTGSGERELPWSSRSLVAILVVGRYLPIATRPSRSSFLIHLVRILDIPSIAVVSGVIPSRGVALCGTVTLSSRVLPPRCRDGDTRANYVLAPCPDTTIECLCRSERFPHHHQRECMSFSVEHW